MITLKFNNFKLNDCGLNGNGLTLNNVYIKNFEYSPITSEFSIYPNNFTDFLLEGVKQMSEDNRAKLMRLLYNSHMTSAILK